MKSEQRVWTESGGWSDPWGDGLDSAAAIVFVFGGSDRMRSGDGLAELKALYPGAPFFGCSTAGEISGVSVSDDTLVATAVSFRSTHVQLRSVTFTGDPDSRAVGLNLASELPREDLVHVMALSDGLHINGSDLVRGLLSGLPENVGLSGGLSGDGGRFQETFVIGDEGPAMRTVSVLGFYGPDIRISCGSEGGWDPFGPERVITRSEGAVLYELDGKPALNLYKLYLGEYASGLPATGLLFPLSIRSVNGDYSVVRTILQVDEATGSLTFAGDMPTNYRARLMKAGHERLLDGAEAAAQACIKQDEPAADLAILISCVGRKMVLNQRIEEELEGVRQVLGPDVTLAGFYSYGEMSPMTNSSRCELHNQTMTVTTFREV